jgi:hypothetical protein
VEADPARARHVRASDKRFGGNQNSNSFLIAMTQYAEGQIGIRGSVTADRVPACKDLDQAGKAATSV